MEVLRILDILDDLLASGHYRAFYHKARAFFPAYFLRISEDGEDLPKDFEDFFTFFPEFLGGMRTTCEAIVASWQAHCTWTKPLYVFGMKEIMPDKAVVYTKPITVLVDELCFSAGDFFPAILQDNQRATLVGTRTAGAGGIVECISFPNQTGFAFFTLTSSLAERPFTGMKIEDFGVTPDIFLTPTARDFTFQYQDFVKVLLDCASK